MSRPTAGPRATNAANAEPSARRVPDPQTAASNAIHEALKDKFLESEPLAHWRASQIDHAIVEYMKGAYDTALLFALRARVPGSEIPLAELSRPLHASVEHLQARLAALKEFFRS